MHSSPPLHFIHRDLFPFHLSASLLYPASLCIVSSRFPFPFFPFHLTTPMLYLTAFSRSALKVTLRPGTLFRLLDPRLYPIARVYVP